MYISILFFKKKKFNKISALCKLKQLKVLSTKNLKVLPEIILLLNRFDNALNIYIFSTKLYISSGVFSVFFNQKSKSLKKKLTHYLKTYNLLFMLITTQELTEYHKPVILRTFLLPTHKNTTNLLYSFHGNYFLKRYRRVKRWLSRDYCKQDKRVL
jgi:hypothetical protein